MQTLAGVKNRTTEAQILTFSGEHVEFGPGEVKIVDSAMANHASTRTVTRHKKGPDGKALPALEGYRLFELVPLEEALKVAKVMENPDIVAARKRAQEKEVEEKAMTERILARLKEQGWRPPEDSANKGGRK
jgi:hypothetical protein